MVRHRRRCEWARNDRAVAYHDEEWGVPVHDDRTLFEFLILEGAQAGLSWDTILRKREAYREAFDGFDPRKIVRMVALGLEKEVVAARWPWICTMCGKCENVCPMEIDIADAVRQVRSLRERDKVPGIVHKGLEALLDLFEIGRTADLGVGDIVRQGGRFLGIGFECVDDVHPVKGVQMIEMNQVIMLELSTHQQIRVLTGLAGRQGLRSGSRDRGGLNPTAVGGLMRCGKGAGGRGEQRALRAGRRPAAG